MPFVYAEDNNSSSIENSLLILNKAKQAASNHQWEIAEGLYKKAKANAVQQGDTQKTLDILFSLLTVYQQQSDGVSAFAIAAEIEQLAVSLSDPFSLTRSYRLLGIAYQSLANNALARDYYSVAVESARDVNQPLLMASLLNELGYADVLVEDYQSAKASFEESYRIARSKNAQDLMLQAQINLLRVQIALGNKQKIKQKFVLLERLIKEIPESEELVEKYISIGTLYRTAQIKLNLNQKYRKTAYTWYERSLKLAKKYENQQLQSIANGYIGQVYADEAQYGISGQFTLEAIVLAQKINNLDLLYRWTVQLARVLSAQNKVDSALKQYEAAIKTLDSLDIVNFMRYERSFNSDVKPVFDEMLSLMFHNVRKLTIDTVIQTELGKLVYYAEKLRRKELAAFCFGNCQLKQEEFVAKIPNHEAVLYTLVSEKYFHVMLKDSAGIRFKTHKISRKTLLTHLEKLAKNIQDGGSESAYLKQAKQLYRWLITPFDDVLKKNKIHTIAIVPAQEFMTLSFDVLFDNKHFLIENYALKYVLSANDLIHASKWKYSGKNYVLQSNQSKLNVFPENIIVKTIYTDQALSTLKSAILDIKSDQLFYIHNKFKLANDYRESVVIGQDENFPLFGLVNKINRGQKIGLLVFSSNKPDKINNVYFNTQMLNATYTVAPLWSYSQEASQALISQFYKSLQNGVNVESALQKAKIALLKNQTFSHPKHWAGMLLMQH